MITIENLTVGYNKKPVKEGLNYTFEEGKIYGLLAASGKGKTTLLKTLSGILPPISGKIISDIDINDFFMMHQAYTSFDWLTCLDNILITEKVLYHRITPEIEARAIKLLDRVGLKDYANYYPSQLSGGQRQRLALARTVFTIPKVILMDEPLSALDEDTRESMQNFILHVHEKTNNTIIIVTHSTKEAEKLCDVIIDDLF